MQVEETYKKTDPGKIRTLVDTALGKVKADMVIVNADLVNVYSGELLKSQSVAVKGDRIAFVGEKADHTIGPDTRIIDASGKTLIPGLIDSHTHTFFYTVEEFVGCAMKGGTTTIITEALIQASLMGYSGVRQLLESARGQPIKVFITVPPKLSMSPAARYNAIHPRMMSRLLRQKDVIGLGETFWQYVVKGGDRVMELFAEAMSQGKPLEGHAAGARGNNLQAYVASGISSCHEGITADEIIQRLRLGIYTMIREGYTHRELDAVVEIIATIKEKKVDCRRLALVTDGVSPKHLREKGYMEFVVQKAIDLGFDPVTAIQMATLNPAEHFGLDVFTGGIAPGKCADMVIIPDLRTIKAEMVISNGCIVAERGENLVSPRAYTFSKSSRKSVRLGRKLQPADFRIPVEGEDIPVTVRVINLVAGTLTREERATITPRGGLLEADIEEDLLKVAVIERASSSGKMFTGFVKGFGMKKGAIASSAAWDFPGLVVVGTSDEDMTGAVNRVSELQGGAVVYAGGRVLAEFPMPIGGIMSDEPLEVICRQTEEVQRKAMELGSTVDAIHLALTSLTTAAIPFFRICETGLMDIKQGELVDLIA